MYRIFSLCVMLLSFVGSVSAQTMWSKTYYNPVQIHVPKMTYNFVTDMNVGNGRTFTGQIEYKDNVVARYSGELKFPDGSKSTCSSFQPDFSVRENVSWIWVDKDQTMAQKNCYRNGSIVTLQQWNINGRAFYILNGDLTFCDSGSPTTPAPNYSSGSSSYSSGGSTSGSSYNSHEAQCRGCNGSGRCQHCNGSGYVNNYKSKCSLCHGSGRCVSCGGQGKVHGNF